MHPNEKTPHPAAKPPGATPPAAMPHAAMPPAATPPAAMPPSATPPAATPPAATPPAATPHAAMPPVATPHAAMPPVATPPPAATRRLPPWAAGAASPPLTEPPHPAPSDPQSETSSSEAFTIHLTQALRNTGGILVSPDIKEKKLSNALSKNMYSGNHQIIGLLDCTVFGSAKEHLMFTANELLWFHKSASPSFGRIEWSDIHRCNFSEPSGWLNSDDIETGIGYKLCTLGSDVKRELLITLLNNIKDLASTYFEPSESGPMDLIHTQSPTQSTTPATPPPSSTVVNEKIKKKALRLYIKATKFMDKGNKKKSSKLFFDASKLFAQSGDLYSHKFSESFAWSEKALAMTEHTPEVQTLRASYSDNAILALNSALEYPEADAVDRTNLRFNESQKYRALSNVEVSYANLARKGGGSSGHIAAEHLRKAAEFSQSGAAAVTEAANLALKIPEIATYHNYIGQYHDCISSVHYYRAWAFEEEDNWIEAYSGYLDSMEEYNKSITSVKQAIAIENDGAYLRNLDKFQAFAVEIQSSLEAAQIQANIQSSTVTDPPIHSGSPELDINVETVEGMVENLVSTISVVLKNNGDGEARNIDVQLTSQFFSGETNGHINSLKPGRSNRIGLSVVPTQAGSPSANFLVQYEDSTGNPFSNKSGLSLIVAQRNQDRPEGGTIVHVHGDYSAGSIIKDSLIQDSTVDASASTAAPTIPDPVPQSIPSTAPAVAPQSNLIAEINQLSQLHEQGILTAEQFETAKDRLLNNQ